jgi:Transposase
VGTSAGVEPCAFGRRSSERLELPRFRGHLTIGGHGLQGGVHDGKNATAISGRVPRRGGAPGPRRRPADPELARDLGCSEQTLRNWVAQAAIDAGEAEGLTSDERAELARLRRENRLLREEREILRKAAAFFAQETMGGPTR